MRTELPCLPLIVERFWNEVKDKKEYNNSKYYPNPELHMFPQVWGDTSLGFGGIGGQAMTFAYTIVVIDNNTGWCGVFFEERLAYVIYSPNQMFYDDLQKGQMASVIRRGKYKREE